MKSNKKKDIYKWEIELSDGTLISSGNSFDKSSVVRISFIPTTVLLPRHDILFSGFRFIKRFSRALMRWDGSFKEYLHCIVTDQFRFYLMSSNGRCLITHKDYELYL